MDVDLKPMSEILKGRKGKPETLIEVMQDVQREYRFLPEEALEKVAKTLSVPVSKVYSAATFYAAFSLTPKGEKIVRLCKGTACHVRGAGTLEEEIAVALNIGPGETTEDMKYSFETVNCLGACAMAPVAVIDDKVHGGVKPGEMKKLLRNG
ncbi:MAG: NADH-quinone oxidoreductase subunit NuoE family protein [Planctomycetota bacterium]|jgi:NADH-quinone oxidoreductase subunit E